MICHFAALATGVLFGLGLAVSEMINPEQVLGFLDIAGDWDPSLAFVISRWNLKAVRNLVSLLAARLRAARRSR